MDAELRMDWIVVLEKHIIGAYADRKVAYAVAKEMNATVYWNDAVEDCIAHLAMMDDFSEGAN